MAQGLDGFLYETKVDGKNTTYHFWDPEDPTNVADVPVSADDTAANPTERSEAEFAYSKVSGQLRDARSKRLAEAEADRVAAANKEAERVATAERDFLDNAREQEIKPVTTEKREDGIVQNVYNANPPEEAAPKSDSKKK